MIVGLEPDELLEKIAKEQGLSIADALRGYAVEDLLERIYGSSYGEFIWLKGMQAIGAANYKKRREACLEFYYVESHRYIAPGKIVAGAPWTAELGEKLRHMLFEGKDEREIIWSVEEGADAPASVSHFIAHWTLAAEYHHMRTTVVVKIEPFSSKEFRPEKHEIALIGFPSKKLMVFEYALESRLADDFFEIIKKLELIADMACYDRVNRILRTEPVSGHHIMEKMKEKLASEPKILREKRIEQLAGYKSYTYMKKRWQQYCKRNVDEEISWEEVMDRLISFGKPVWHALCSGEVFLDDWMPELSRFLG